jgi:uncharacterized protein YxjI
MRYLVQERLFSIRADFWIEDQDGNRVFVVDGKALSLRETFELKDAYGNLLIVIRKKFFSMRDTMEIENGNGIVATVRPAFFSPIKHLFDGTRLEAVGNFADKDWEIKDGHRVIGRISRRWFRIRDTYGVEVEQGVDDPLMIAIAICIDRIYEDEKREREHHDGGGFGGGFGGGGGGFGGF